MNTLVYTMDVKHIFILGHVKIMNVLKGPIVVEWECTDKTTC